MNVIELFSEPVPFWLAIDSSSKTATSSSSSSVTISTSSFLEQWRALNTPTTLRDETGEKEEEMDSQEEESSFLDELSHVFLLKEACPLFPNKEMDDGHHINRTMEGGGGASSSEDITYVPYFLDYGPYPIYSMLQVLDFFETYVSNLLLASAPPTPSSQQPSCLVWLLDSDNKEETTNQVLIAMLFVASTMMNTAGGTTTAVGSSGPSSSSSSSSVSSCLEYLRAVFGSSIQKFCIPFHDASNHEDSFGITIWDCVEVILHSGCLEKKSSRMGNAETRGSFFPPSTASAPRKAISGGSIRPFIEASSLMAVLDCSIVTPQIVAMSTPGVSGEVDAARVEHVFSALGVEAVIQLSDQPEYDPDLCLGGEGGRQQPSSIQHYLCDFPDGSIPTLEIVERVLEIIKQVTSPQQDGNDELLAPATTPTTAGGGAVALHCKAGIGRTGTLIALYLIDAYGLSGRHAIAWTRLCRQGAVVGAQQEFVQWYAGVSKAERLPVKRRQQPPKNMKKSETELQNSTPKSYFSKVPTASKETNREQTSDGPEEVAQKGIAELQASSITDPEVVPLSSSTKHVTLDSTLPAKKEDPKSRSSRVALEEKEGEVQGSNSGALNYYSRRGIASTPTRSTSAAGGGTDGHEPTPRSSEAYRSNPDPPIGGVKTRKILAGLSTTSNPKKPGAKDAQKLPERQQISESEQSAEAYHPPAVARVDLGVGVSTTEVVGRSPDRAAGTQQLPLATGGMVNRTPKVIRVNL